MSDQVFYVGSIKNRQLTGYVPAKFLTINGKPVVDPTPGGSQKTFIYADGSDKYKTSGAIANPNNYLIVPANYTEQQAKAFAAKVADTLSAKGASEARDQMTDAFSQGGSQDVQRNPQWGIPEGSVVPAFVSSASYHLGSVTRQAGLPREWAEIGGGLKNLENRFIRQPWNYVFSKDHDWNSIDTSGPHFLSRNNYDNFSKGFADAGAANTGTSVNDYFGYYPQAQYPAGQIGDGNGLGVGDWRFAFAGIDPSHPFRPVPPLQTDSQSAPKLVRVNPNSVPAAPGSLVTPSDSRSLMDDRSGNVGSVPAGNASPSVSNRSDSFDDRFGNWDPAPVSPSGETSSPVLRALKNYRRPVTPDVAPSTLAPGTAAPTNMPAQPPAVGKRSENAEGAPGSPVRRLSRRVINPSAAAAYEPGASAAPLAPSGDQDFSGSLLGRLVAIAGIAPQNPTQPAPPPEDEEQEQPDLQALSAKLSSSGDIRDAVALYNAIRSSRR